MYDQRESDADWMLASRKFYKGQAVERRRMSRFQVVLDYICTEITGAHRYLR
jgi:hypothetical protein